MRAVPSTQNVGAAFPGRPLPEALPGNEPIGLWLLAHVRFATIASERAPEHAGESRVPGRHQAAIDGQGKRRGGSGRRGRRFRARDRADARRRSRCPRPRLARGCPRGRRQHIAAAAQHLFRYRRFSPAPTRLHVAHPRGRGTAGPDPEVGRSVVSRRRTQAQRMVETQSRRRCRAFPSHPTRRSATL